ncbi:MAG TPA: efflux transporter outer membrane subunit, partial [Casimicrobiaceae bacterium]
MKSARARLLIASFALLGGGCAVGPDYRAPPTAAPAAWSEAPSRGTTTGAVQVVRWWKIFGDPELDSLVERAAQANPELRIAEARLREARALRAGAISDLAPTISASGSYANQRCPENAPTCAAPSRQPSTNLYDVRFDASWEIDVFGGKRRALESATAQLEAVEEERRDVLVSVLAEVARNYVDLRGLQQRLAVTRKNIRAQSEAVEITRARFNAGLTSELDVKQAEALVATTQSQLPAMETAMKQVVHRLGVLLGQQPGTLIAELSSARPIPAPPPTVAVGLPSDLLRRRPDVRRAERKLAAATANIGVETAELFPKFSLLGSSGLQSVSAGDWLSAGSRYWSVGPTLTWRLLDFGRIHARVKAADARQEQALVAYEKTVLTSFEDVENTLVAYANEQARFDSLKASVSANRRTLELANELYTKGLGDFLGVLDAERSLYQAEDQLADSQRTVTQRLVALYKALGGGWEEEAGSPQARDELRLNRTGRLNHSQGSSRAKDSNNRGYRAFGASNERTGNRFDDALADEQQRAEEQHNAQYPELLAVQRQRG